MLLRQRSVTIENLIAIVITIVIATILGALVTGPVTKGSSSWIGGGLPDWVAQEVVGEDGPLLAIGAVTGTTNEPLAWEIADQRTHGQITKVLHSHVAVLLRDPNRDDNETVGHNQRGRAEQLVQRVQTTFVAQTL